MKLLTHKSCIPDAPCMEYLPTFGLNLLFLCKYSNPMEYIYIWVCKAYVRISGMETLPLKQPITLFSRLGT